MPYVTKDIRKLLDSGRSPQVPGELNYLITKLCIDYIKRTPLGINYTVLNDVIGALECAKHEFIRRVVNDYENGKIVENGDVYPRELWNRYEEDE